MTNKLNSMNGNYKSIKITEFKEKQIFPRLKAAVESAEMTMEEAGGIHSEYTPKGWMKTEKELLIFEQHLYLRQPGYGTSYITGKYLLEDAMAEFARIKELKNERYHTKEFFDTMNSIGNIPAALGHWELTGDKTPLLRIIAD